MTDKTRVPDALQDLSETELRAVAEFVESLRHKTTAPRPGSPEAVLRAAGSWWMTPDETRQFLNEVEEIRHREDADRAVPPQY